MCGGGGGGDKMTATLGQGVEWVWGGCGGGGGR